MNYITPKDVTKKFQVFEIFDGAEANKIVEDVTAIVKPDQAALAEAGVNVETRNNMVYHVPKSSTFNWIYRKINPFLKSANDLWNFDVIGFENLQLLKYVHTNAFDWHMDGFSPKTSTRKMGFSIALCDPEDYRGGELEMWWRNEKYVVPPLKKGAMIVFPAFLMHRVAKVLSGKRLHLVSWVYGDKGWK